MISQLLNRAKKIIPLSEAEILLAYILKKDRSYIVAHPEFPISLYKRLFFYYVLKKRNRGIPIAYLLGHKEFFGIDFIVNRHTLIPRPETELMVEEVLSQIQKYFEQSHKNLNQTNDQKDEKIILIDIGTGSGCIPISIIKNIPEKKVTSIAVDTSSFALRVAGRNAKNHNVAITFLHGNLLEPLNKIFSLHQLDSASKQTTPYLLFITANLPYLRTEQYNNEPSIQHEPRHALVAQNNGLALYEELLQQLQKIFQQTMINRFSTSLFLEIDPSQSRQITELIKKYFPDASVKIKADLRNQDRLVIITFH